MLGEIQISHYPGIVKRDYRHLLKTFFLTFFIFTYSLKAQDNSTYQNEDKSCYWISAGIGKCYFGPTIYWNISYLTGANLITVRYFKANEFQIDPGGTNYDEPPLGIKEIGIMYGRAYRKEIVTLSFAAGIGYIKGINRGKQIEPEVFEKLVISGIGFPLEAKSIINITNFLSFGVSCYGNVNSQKTFFGGALELSLGKF